MVKVLIIRDKILSFNGGIKRHCEDLAALMNDFKQIEILPIRDIPSKYIKSVHKFKYDEKALREYISGSGCDIVHIHGFMSLGAVQAIKVASAENKKIVYSPHFHPFKYLDNPFLGKMFFSFFLKPTLKKVDTVLTINDEDTSFFSRYHSNVVKIPHWYRISHEEQSYTKKENMILFVGRNDANKGLEHLYQLPSRYEVHCVTKGPLLRDDFILHQNISDYDLSRLYQQAKVVVIPSRYEAFSLVALEALNHYTPIVISDRVRIGDYLKGFKCCQVFGYHDYDGFNSAIERICSCNSFDFDLALKAFTPELIREEYYNIYTS